MPSVEGCEACAQLWLVDYSLLLELVIHLLTGDMHLVTTLKVSKSAWL